MSDTDNKASLLFVDDEPRVLTSMRAMFRREYNVSLANSGLEALAVLERESIDVIVSDQRMPGMTGIEVLKAFKDKAPNAMRILLTGYADQEAIAASINEGEVFRYLTKPCPADLLKETVALAVEAVKGTQVQEEKPAIAVAPPARYMPEDLIESADAMLDEVFETPRKEPVQKLPDNAPPISLESKDVELLLLSNDAQLTTALSEALEGAHVLHAVGGIGEAVEVLEKHPIGVLITDIAINADEVQELTNQLKQQVPELVTIVASDHSDAHRLIDLINGGQVFRFLLKPIRLKQTSIWIESAVGKHIDLVANPDLLARHVVTQTSGSSLRKLSDQLVGIASRMMRLRARPAQPNQA
jgi:DNA-binding NtrC family response regulator